MSQVEGAASRSTIPAADARFFRRPRLTAGLELTGRRLTLLRAPFGFGKTALLADACRAERDKGTAVLWLRCTDDARDGTLARDLARALANVDADLPPVGRAEAAVAAGPTDTVRWLANVVSSYRRPFVVALDDVERLGSKESAWVIEFLLRHGPANLHLALAMRSNRCGVDIATPMVLRRGHLLDAETLRFSAAETARCLGRGWSRSQLASANQLAEGWPAALGIVRGLHDSGQWPVSRDAPSRRDESMREQLRMRLVRDLSGAAGEYLLDISLAETIRLSLLEAAFPDSHAECWDELAGALIGLIRPLDSTGSTYRMNPMVRDVLRQRRAVDVKVFRHVHGRLAKAHAVEFDGPLGGDDGLAHAALARDWPMYAGFVDARGGLAMLFTEGPEAFVQATRHLTAKAVDEVPRLAPVRIAALLLQGRYGCARTLLKWFRGWAAAVPGLPPAEVRADCDIVEALEVAFSCRLVDEADRNRLLANVAGNVDDRRAAPARRGIMEFILASSNSQRSSFERSRRWASRAQVSFRLAGADPGYRLVELQKGIDAMAQGRVGDAADAYARSDFPALARTLALELQFERDTGSSRVRARRTAADRRITGWFDIEAAEHGNRVEAAFDRAGANGALSVLEESLDWAAARDMSRLMRILAAQRVFWLVRAGDVEAAHRTWREADLPETTSRLLDISRQSWRELEALCGARIALLGALGEIDGARRLAGHVRVSALGWGLKRLLMRSLVTWAALEHRESNADGAEERLVEFLGHYRDTDYSRPLVREGEAPVAILENLLRERSAPEIGPDALALLGRLDATASTPRPNRALEFSARQRAVLGHVAKGLRNKEIARSLDITESGVRYHLRALYRKLGTSNRLDSVRRARQQGVDLPS